MKNKYIIFTIIFFISLFFIFYFKFVESGQIVNLDNLHYVSKISKCDNSICFQDFFEDYTIKNGAINSIIFFKQITSQYPEYTSDCHYMFHGIGHGAFKKNGNVQESLTLGGTTEVLMNIPTCGNGYYHGVIEAYVGEHDLDEKKLVEKLNFVCLALTNNQVKIDCYHGLGHAILIHLDGNIQKAVSLCDKVSPDSNMQSMCHTGIFMEMVRDESPNNKVLTFAKCESLPTEIQRAECFNQHSYLLDDFLNSKDVFIKNMLECERNIKDMEDRIICIRKEKL